jgi:hypothetical protein
MSKLETNTIDTISGTNTLQVGDGNVATINLGKSGDTINVPSGVTIANSGTATGFGGTNTPAFYATAGTTAQTISNTTFTKMNFGTEILDTDSAYDTSASTFTIPSGKGGLYCFFNNIRMPLSNGEESAFMINVDGSNILYSGQQNVLGNNGSFYHQYSTLINVSAGDACYLNMYVTSTANRTTIASYCYFGAYKLIE